MQRIHNKDSILQNIARNSFLKSAGEFQWKNRWSNVKMADADRPASKELPSRKGISESGKPAYG
jgi:hypothetical protein